MNILANQVKEITARFASILDESLLAVKNGVGPQPVSKSNDDNAAKLQELNTLRTGLGA